MSRPPAPNPFIRAGDRVLDKSSGADLLLMAEQNNFSVSKVAKSLGLSVIQLQKHVENTIGLKPKELFCKHRAVLTKRMICEGADLHEISDQLGYHHYSHFCTDTKRFFGISPTQLEKKLRGSMDFSVN